MPPTKAKRKAKPVRRQPKQRRSRETVDAVLDAVAKVLKRDGAGGLTTNHIARAAGVSIGSIYQYFPNKAALYTALFNRHIEESSRLVESTLVEHAASPLDEVVRALVEAMIEVHAIDPALHELLSTGAPHGAEVARDFEKRLHGALRLAISSRPKELGVSGDLERKLFVLTQMIEALSHGVVLRRPPRMSLAAAKEEAVRAVLVYLHA
ncbi:TetR/AcrR family transcriptional regulator [Pendulispora brunnea]|uniref:TetR/AcrR family transcriptional regulator n=1 Tax=Pendulispora brunnea TaxID=2905690 RepID=A0ABZ2KDP2_9BACT